MYKDLSVSADIPEAKLRRAAKTGVFTLSKSDLSGSGASLTVHPETYQKIMKAKKSGKGTRIHITPHEIEYAMTTKQGGSVYGIGTGGRVAKGSEAAKQRMAHVRAARRHGGSMRAGSFRLN